MKVSLAKRNVYDERRTKILEQPIPEMKPNVLDEILPSIPTDFRVKFPWFYFDINKINATLGKSADLPAKYKNYRYLDDHYIAEENETSDNVIQYKGHDKLKDEEGKSESNYLDDEPEGYSDSSVSHSNYGREMPLARAIVKEDSYVESEQFLEEKFPGM